LSDVLSTALRGVQLTSALFLNGEYRAPWGFSSPPVRSMGQKLAPGTEHLMIFHLVTEGAALARVAGSEPTRVRAGEIVVFPHGDGHELSSGRGVRLIDASAVLPSLLDGELHLERGGGTGAATKFICGYFGCDRFAAQLLLAGLPPFFTVDIRRDPSGAWIENALQHLVKEAESARPGRLALLSKLSEALFVETLRRYMEELPAEQKGWFAAARDEVVGRALTHLHGDPLRPWSLPDLAKLAGASRTVLAERFALMLGRTPLAYVAQLRLQHAARLLETSDRSVINVATEVGYESEAAFNRAFKRSFGLPPARYRRQRQSA
jgi:AraC-like DNA-binding protein